MYQFSLNIKIAYVISFYMGLVLISQFGEVRPRARFWSKFSDSKTIEHHLQWFSNDFEWSGSPPTHPNKHFIVGLVASMIGTGLGCMYISNQNIRV